MISNNTPTVRSPFWRDLALLSQPQARELVPLKWAREHALLPLGLIQDGTEKPVLSVAVARNLSPEDKRSLEALLNVELVTESAGEAEVIMAIDAAYFLNSPDGIGVTAPAPPSLPEVELSTIPRVVQTILTRAIALGASDIHIDPGPHASSIRFRVDGVLRTDGAIRLTEDEHLQVVRRLKVLCKIEHTAGHRPLDGSFRFIQGSLHSAIRVATLPTSLGEKIVLRIHDGSAPSKLHELGLSPHDYAILTAHLSFGSGIILCAGPTGSGKTTLLYGCLNHLAAPERNIISLEDPVERDIKYVSQVTVDLRDTEKVQQILPAILRQDPDVLLIGEIRERLTARAVISTGLTGHLVLSTIHAESGPKVLDRLRSFDIEQELLSGLSGLIITQRLLPKICLHCRRSKPLSNLARSVFHLTPNSGFHGGGCHHCMMSGKFGRRAVYELCPLRGGEIQRQERSPYRPLAVSIREALLSGEIDEAVALRALGIQ